MNTTDYLSLVKSAGGPVEQSMRAVDRWIAERFKMSERQAREWRLKGRPRECAVVALREMARR